MDAEGKFAYVSKRRLDSRALNLFAAPEGEMLWEPHGELCVKTCAPTSFRPSGWFGDDEEARCPSTGGANAAGGAGGIVFPNAAAVRNALIKLNTLGYPQGAGASGSDSVSWNGNGNRNENRNEKGNARQYGMGTQASAGSKTGVGSSFSMESVFQLMRGDAGLGGLGNERLCLPLEAHYEPMVFRRDRRRQNNLYYRFEVLPLGAKHCCCL